MSKQEKSVLELLQKAPCYAIALEESGDIVDEEQMSIFMRFLDIETKAFMEELLAILPFKGKTHKDLFKTFEDFMTKSNISYDKMVSLSTDRAPAMIGKEKGLVKRIKDKNAKLSVHNLSGSPLWKTKCHSERSNGQLDPVD